MTSILIVSHGGSKNDTLVTLEYKVNDLIKSNGEQLSIFDLGVTQ